MTGEELLRLPGTTEPNDFVSTKRVAYSPDGKLLVACDRNQVKIYDPASGDLLETLDGHQADVTAIAFRPDGKYIASGDRWIGDDLGCVHRRFSYNWPVIRMHRRA